MDIQAPTIFRKPLRVPEKTLMGPGPSNCPPRVLKALSLPILGHLHPEVTHIMDEIKEGIKYIFQTRNGLTLAVSTSGHGGMEAVLCNLLEPGDRVLITVNGIWGERASIMASRYGATVYQIEAEPGQNFTLEEIETHISKIKPKLFFTIQGESSTGVYQPLEGIGDICHRHNCLFAVDTVASLGGVPFLMDKWGIDAVYTGSQKVLGAPPGITPISFSPQAQKAIFNRKTPVSVFYWDMTILGDYWSCFGRPRLYHHTISCTLLYGLREALALIVEEGLENVISRHQQCADQLHEGLHRLNLDLYVRNSEARLTTVTTIKVPEHLDWRAIISYAMKEHCVEISGGLGPTINKVFRIGLMGYNATPEKVNFVLNVLEEALHAVQKNRQSKL